MQTPKVFISYSHDNDEHREWVCSLASRLVESGIDVVLDQWDIQLGSNILQFMEKGLASSDRVLVICTDNYNNKSNEGRGGVGYEKNILTAELFNKQDTNKFIPCIRGVGTQSKTPIYLGGRAYVDFTDDSDFDANLKQLLHELFGVPLKPKPALGKNPFAIIEENKQPFMNNGSSTVFFDDRLSDAFPGVRGIQWFKDPIEAVKRLKLFFRTPFVFPNSTPIWWWRSGNMYIDHFEVLSPDTILLGRQELIVEELAAINASDYYQSFIYIKTKPSPPTGLYDPSTVPMQVEDRGYAREEFGLFRDRPVSRAEYDDGSTIIDGEVISMNQEAQLRVRYTTPYNLLIAPKDSPINNIQFDRQLNERLNAVLKGEEPLEILVNAILKLPKR